MRPSPDNRLQEPGRAEYRGAFQLRAVKGRGETWNQISREARGRSTEEETRDESSIQYNMERRDSILKKAECAYDPVLGVQGGMHELRSLPVRTC